MTINPLVLELAIKEMGRDDAKKLAVRNYRKKVVKLGGDRQKPPANSRMRERGRVSGRINSHQISFVLVPPFLVMSSKMANPGKNREGKRTFSVILRSKGRQESKESNRIRP